MARLIRLPATAEHCCTQAAKGETVKASYAECQDLILQYQRGKLELQPGCNAEQSLETLVTGKLNTIRETASKVLARSLDPSLLTV